MNKIVIYYIGDRFYHESHTRIQPYQRVTDDNQFAGIAMGQFDSLLEKGYTLVIKGAPSNVIHYFEELLSKQ